MYYTGGKSGQNGWEAGCWLKFQTTSRGGGKRETKTPTFFFFFSSLNSNTHDTLENHTNKVSCLAQMGNDNLLIPISHPTPE